MKHRLAWIAVLFFPLILGGAAPQQGCLFPDSGSVPLPDGYSAHLENPNLAFGPDCAIFATTRPNSGVGTLIWKVPPGGQPEIIMEIDPRRMYALGEFGYDNRGRLYVFTVPDPIQGQGGDNLSIDYYRVPGWTP